MFNTLFEHLFVCQSLLKEWRRPPTGGLRVAFKEPLWEGFPCPRPLEWGQKRPLKPLLFGFPLAEENNWLLVVLGRCSQTSVLSLAGSLPINDR